MDASEKADFERQLARDPAARAVVDEIRAAAQMLGDALAAEPAPAPLPGVAAAAIVAGKDPRKLDGGPLPFAKDPADPYAQPKGPAKFLRFPQLYFLVTTAAAACFTAFFVYWSHNRIESLPTRLIEVPLNAVASTPTPAPAPAEAAAKREIEVRFTEQLAAQEQLVAQAEAEVKQRALRGSRAVTFGASAKARDIFAVRAAPSAHPDLPAPPPGSPAANTEAYARIDENPFLAVAQNPLSTFSVDVDTAAYANVRRFLQAGQRPPRDAVRIEELINYFPYRYAAPRASDGAPFAASLEVASAPWAPEHRLVRIGLKGREVSEAARPAANLVFLLDVSGSMSAPNKLPLVKKSLGLLVERLRPADRVAIVVYAGASGMALPSTSAAEKAKILAAIDALRPEGSTNGEAGIQLAYDIAKANFIAGGANRVILATDGDFNVGVASEGELTRLVEEKAKAGVFLTVLGFGMGNLKDGTLEQIADKGNGHYAYIDSLQEARKTLVEQAGGTLVTIAQDVKLQVEFNPALAQAYRLIGYENRTLRKEDFNNDKVDAGEIGAGHTVTALYEIIPPGQPLPEGATSVDPLKYQQGGARPVIGAGAGELLTVKVRYKEPGGATSRLLEFPLRDEGRAFAEASADFKFAASVAAFGMVLRDSPHRGAAKLSDIAAWAQAGLEDDAGGYRAEFIALTHAAQALLPAQGG